jgi:hypothetical protein
MERRAKKSRTVVDEAGQAKTEETYEEQTVQQAAPPPPPPVVEQRSVEEYHTED